MIHPAKRSLVLIWRLLLMAIVCTAPAARAGWGWKALPSDEEIHSAALAAIPSRPVESWTTSKRHDAAQPVQNPLWVNHVVLAWLEANPNHRTCDPNDPDCTPSEKYWCGHSELAYENGWTFSLGEPLYGVDDLGTCVGFIAYAPGWIGTDNQSPNVSLVITSQTLTRIELLAQASDPDGDTLSYTWYVDENKTGATNPDVFWNDPPVGEHMIRVVVSDSKGGTAEDTVTFTVGNPPKRYVIAPGPQEGEGTHYGFIKEVVVDGKEDSAEKNTLLYPGSRVKTGPGVEIVVQWSSGAVSRVKQKSEIEVQERTIATTPFKVVVNRLINGVYEFYWPRGHEGAAKFEVSTQRAIVGIKGTRLTVSHLNGVTTVEVQEGEVEVTDLATGAVSTVSAGQSARFDGSGGGASLEAALDLNGNGVLDDAEIRQAVQYWILGQTVPGADQTIDDAKIRELIQMWILGTPVNAIAASSGAVDPASG